MAQLAALLAERGLSNFEAQLLDLGVDGIESLEKDVTDSDLADLGMSKAQIDALRGRKKAGLDPLLKKLLDDATLSDYEDKFVELGVDGIDSLKNDVEDSDLEQIRMKKIQIKRLRRLCDEALAQDPSPAGGNEALAQDPSPAGGDAAPAQSPSAAGGASTTKVSTAPRIASPDAEGMYRGVPGWLVALTGKDVLTKQGRQPVENMLAGKTTFGIFSGSNRCGQSMAFVPKLTDFYTKYKTMDPTFEVIYANDWCGASNDGPKEVAEKAEKYYMENHGDWPMCPMDARSAAMQGMFANDSTIQYPFLQIVDVNGKKIKHDLVDDIRNGLDPQMVLSSGWDGKGRQMPAFVPDPRYSVRFIQPTPSSKPMNWTVAGRSPGCAVDPTFEEKCTVDGNIVRVNNAAGSVAVQDPMASGTHTWMIKCIADAVTVKDPRADIGVAPVPVDQWDHGRSQASADHSDMCEKGKFVGSPAECPWPFIRVGHVWSFLLDMDKHRLYIHFSETGCTVAIDTVAEPLVPFVSFKWATIQLQISSITSFPGDVYHADAALERRHKKAATVPQKIKVCCNNDYAEIYGWDRSTPKYKNLPYTKDYSGIYNLFEGTPGSEVWKHESSPNCWIWTFKNKRYSQVTDGTSLLVGQDWPSHKDNFTGPDTSFTVACECADLYFRSKWTTGGAGSLIWIIDNGGGNKEDMSMGIGGITLAAVDN